jgi:cyclohexa-1,5-dienecarbonyl-CoA hydratase
MPDYKHIKFELNNDIARIIFNRPPLNILNIEMMKEITTALGGLVGNNNLKLVVVTAVPKAFSAGVDISEHMGEKGAEMIQVFHNIFRLMIKVGKPTLAIVNGACLGGGCEIALFCDMVIASEGVKFGQPEIQVGVFPPIACMVLPRIISQKKALELLLTGCLIPAQEAERAGLINRVVPAEQLEAETNTFISKITALSAPVLSLTRQAALGRYHKEFLDYLPEVEKLYLEQLMKTEDATEGLKAFMEKRKPVWKNK